MSSTALDDFDSRHDGAGAPRWHIDSSTLQVLEHVFSIDQFPNVDVRNQLGTDLNVTPRQIQVWFQNRRQRERKRRDLSRKKRTLEGSSPSKGSSTATLSSQSLSSSSATLCASSEDISSALLDDYDETDALPCSSQEGACDEYGADAACSEERMSLIINGLTNDMQMGQ
ncbi:family 47 [Chrysochromulina tobinii]|uniref:Family 47 n=1 Tax=Chrysochromulina tobinii TaxID=1460289 RepID=A0A0M0JJH2_9EUKA|nr:family 47 [Chrysochromulina tobinii]|eukprot:KOO26452.1 family 47 [Chrysochromulina sp. CCMP291]